MNRDRKSWIKGQLEPRAQFAPGLICASLVSIAISLVRVCESLVRLTANSSSIPRGHTKTEAANKSFKRPASVEARERRDVAEIYDAIQLGLQRLKNFQVEWDPHSGRLTLDGNEYDIWIGAVSHD